MSPEAANELVFRAFLAANIWFSSIEAEEAVRAAFDCFESGNKNPFTFHRKDHEIQVVFDKTVVSFTLYKNAMTYARRNIKIEEFENYFKEKMQIGLERAG